jgi:DNA-binding CsgD family transcriptional regulator
VLGRESECRAIDAVLAAADGGSSAALVLWGEAGMGKTTLLEYAIVSAADMTVIRIAGIQSESEFGFGALHRLLVPFMDRIRALPRRQQDAIGTAFGIVDGPPPDRFLVGLAALTVLSDIAAERPLLCVVDDAQWLDWESLAALGLIARRLFAEGIAMLFAVRISPDAPVPERPLPLEGLPSLEVSGLDEHAAMQLITTLTADPVDAAVARKIVVEAEGCPLAVREVVTSLRREQLSGHVAIPDPLPIGAELERHFLRRVQALPADTRTALLLAAAEPSGDLSVLWRACKRLGADLTALEPARSAGLLVASREAAFRHPLIRSAVYNGASVADRRAAHLALAEATDPASHPEARAWHLADGAAGPDETTAALLEVCALRARERGHYAEEAAFWARGADLTADRRHAASSLLAAAQAHFAGGAVDASQQLLARASPDLATPLLRAQAQRLEAALTSFFVPSQIPLLLLDAATSLEKLDVRLARDTYAAALAACAVSAQATAGTTPKDVALAALRAPSLPDQDPTVEDILLEAFAARFAVGYPDAVPAYRRCVETLCAYAPEPGVSRWAVFGSKAAEELWDEAGYGVMLAKMEQAQRQRGALDSLRLTLNRLADYQLWTGQFALADAYHSEAAEIAAALGEDAVGWLMVKAELLAWQGRESEARVAATRIICGRDDAGVPGVAVNSALLGLAVLDIANGRYADALASARQVFDHDPLTHGNHCLREVVEAGVRAGDHDIAFRALARLEMRGQASGTPWALGLVARCRALMAEDDAAEGLFREALGHLAATPVITDVARTHLLYGEWLRRQGRRADARSQLQDAHELFTAMGASAFARRAARELGATGARARRRNAGAATQLTAQELRIARLAGTGATSKEIGAELFLSPRTIDAHLRSVFAKLGITSRRELRDMQLP